MKAILAGLISLFSVTLNAQQMKTPEEVIVQLFVNTDLQNWSAVEACFGEKVVLDYSSMNGNPATTLSPVEITTAWKGILPGFQHTHHQLGNFLVEQNGNQATAFCYGTATHYLEDEGGNVWTVVGSYDFELEKSSEGVWQIRQMKFNFKYQEGNQSLPAKAIEAVNKKQ